MKNLLGFVSFVLIVGGINGLLVDHLWGLHIFGFVSYLVPADHRTAGYFVLIAVGALLAAATALLDRREGGGRTRRDSGD
ncbi:hypothetical protein OG196_05870 [Kitasatospora purpeofusca]|uniref:hypothetical protein n=1 Tax=Kitasatospora purpeofusca TaxID=67352 RepID=UPI002E120D49|nr:hypothetical protein OG196_05870 [Kitasatospora purpeofusca]